MEIKSVSLQKINEKLKTTKYKRWAFEFDELNNRYCLSIFDSYNSDDEIVIYLHSIELGMITHAIRYKGNGDQNTISKKHYLYQEAEELIKKVFIPSVEAA